MTLGKFVIFGVGVLVGGVVGYAATKSDSVQKASKASIKAGLKAKNWTVDTFQNAANEVKEMVQDAKAEKKVEVKA